MVHTKKTLAPACLTPSMRTFWLIVDYLLYQGSMRPEPTPSTEVRGTFLSFG